MERGAGLADARHPGRVSSSPYATVLIPTHDRHLTLPLALRSACSQTVADIEIVVACDGATDAVLEAARAAAETDPRIRVLDLPKGHNRGGVARAAALDAARSDRIFPLQDDDLWFPDHVAELGPLLDEHDVVTGATLAVRPSGRLSGWVSAYGSPSYRQAARTTGLKLVFEAHYAFSLSSYRRLDVGWDRVAHDGNIRRLLDRHLAEDSTRWASGSAYTSLSFNAPVRTAIDDDAFDATLRDSLDRIEAGDSGAELGRTALWGGPLWHATDRVPPRPGDDVDSYLGRLGLRVGREAVAADDLAVDLSPEQRSHLEQCFGFLTGRPDQVHMWSEILLDLAEPFAGPEPRAWALAVALCDQLGTVEACDLAGEMLASVDDGRPVAALREQRRHRLEGLVGGVVTAHQRPALVRIASLRLDIVVRALEDEDLEACIPAGVLEAVHHPLPPEIEASQGARVPGPPAHGLAGDPQHFPHPLQRPVSR